MYRSVFSINTFKELEQITLDIFRLQANTNNIYKQYINLLNIDITKVNRLKEIPFLPIEFFKSHKVVSAPTLAENAQSIVFTSSATTGATPSKHFVSDVEMYEMSYQKGFELFYGKPQHYTILALLPNYLEREGSSLVYMMNDLIAKSKNNDSGFFLSDLDELQKRLHKQKQMNKPTLLLGVSYALLDFSEKMAEHSIEFENLIVMETGGMKGKRKEMLREEMHKLLCKNFGVSQIHSEYGMTELLSQAYSKGHSQFQTPPWMHVMIRDTNDPFAYVANGKSGGINIIDLANVNSCCFIATQDVGKITTVHNTFEVLGRFDNSDIRGCNLMVL
jgi:phenylacetate-coenzyme A ligase PaaK-like adenylate-forming protein